MTKLRNLFARMRKDQNGATMIEYSILIGIITAAVVASVVIMGGRVAVWWTTLTTATAG
jgi:pilus assembly protein Flp/PilA